MSSFDATAPKLMDWVCRLCGKHFSSSTSKRNLLTIFGKPIFTVVLEELTGPIAANDELTAVCIVCSKLLRKYNRNKINLERLESVIKYLAQNNAHARKKCALSAPGQNENPKRCDANSSPGCVFPDAPAGATGIKAKLSPDNVRTACLHVTVQLRGVSPRLEKCDTCCRMYHCPYCKPAIFKPTVRSKVLKHLDGHARRAVQHSVYSIFKCNLECQENAHFHCPSCTKLFDRRSRFLDHLIQCGSTASVSEDVTSAGTDPDLAAFNTCPHEATISACPDEDAIIAYSEEAVISTCPQEVTISAYLDEDAIIVCPQEATIISNPQEDAISTYSDEAAILACPDNPAIISCPQEATISAHPHKADMNPHPHEAAIMNQVVSLEATDANEFGSHQNATVAAVQVRRGKSTMMACPYCGVEMHKKNLKKHIERKH